jgi:hypothetical protein
MPERLERDLRRLGLELAYPEPPDVAAAIGERLRAEPAPRRSLLGPRRPLAVALAALAAAVVTALAVPPVRGALFDLLGIGGVTIERVEELPAVAPSQDLRLGDRVTLGEARRRVDFPVLVPRELGEPDAVFHSSAFPGGAVSLLYGTERSVRALVTQFRGTTEPGLIKKTASDRKTFVTPVTVRGRFGYFISGEPHFVAYRDADGEIREDEFRLARNVLLWVEDGVTYRIETGAGRQRALRLARSLE